MQGGSGRGEGGGGASPKNLVKRGSSYSTGATGQMVKSHITEALSWPGIMKMLLIKRKKKPGLKSNPGLVLIGLQNNWAPVFFRVQ